MRAALALVVLSALSIPVAQAGEGHRRDRGMDLSTPSQSLKTSPQRARSCAEYGAGFVRVEGTNSCVRIGGSIGVEAGSAIGAR